jgi:uncharacterized protein (TIGR03437 family)
VVFSVHAGGDLAYGVRMWKEHSASGTVSAISNGGIVNPPSFQAAAAPVYCGNRAVVQNQDYNVNSPSSPARVGSTVIAYLIGSGPVSNAPKSGAIAPSSPLSYMQSSPIAAKIGTTNAPVVFAGQAPGFVGLLQMNITIPDLPTGDYPLFLTLRANSSHGPMIAVIR